MTLRGPGSRLAGTSVPIKLIWPRKGWADANLVMDQLLDLFPDKYPILTAKTEESWELRLSWPRHLLEFVDPLLSERARTCYGLDLCQLADYLEVRSYGRACFVFSMFHSWALVAPALAGKQAGSSAISNVVHVDAHHDLGAPLLSILAPSVLTNTRFNVRCSLDDSENVLRAVDLGLISKGSFLAAYILGSSTGSLVHVNDGLLPDKFWLQPSATTISMEGASCPQHFLTFQRCPILGAWKLFELPSLPETLPVDGAGAVWLDVDLDAFCNRFDGDSDRRNLLGSAEEARIMEQRIAKFLVSLSKATWLRRVEAVSIAASPGFFPSEYWESAIPTVCDGIGKALSDV